MVSERNESSQEGLIEVALRRAGRQLVVHVDGPELRPSEQLVAASDPYHPRSERIRALRTELLLLNSGSPLMLAVVGAGAREGRSMLAAELALAFGQLGRRTLLVDADLRNPVQHVFFQTDNLFGLSHTIEGSHPGIVYRVLGLPAMNVITSGMTQSNPSELLSDGRFDRLAANWRRQYEFIILDTPPVSQFADGLTVAAQSGRVLVVSRVASTRFRDLKEMLRRLAVTRSNVLGAVINDF